MTHAYPQTQLVRNLCLGLLTFWLTGCHYTVKHYGKDGIRVFEPGRLTAHFNPDHRPITVSLTVLRDESIKASAKTTTIDLKCQPWFPCCINPEDQHQITLCVNPTGRFLIANISVASTTADEINALNHSRISELETKITNTLEELRLLGREATKITQLLITAIRARPLRASDLLRRAYDFQLKRRTVRLFPGFRLRVKTAGSDPLRRVDTHRRLGLSTQVIRISTSSAPERHLVFSNFLDREITDIETPSNEKEFLSTPIDLNQIKSPIWGLRFPEQLSNIRPAGEKETLTEMDFVLIATKTEEDWNRLGVEMPTEKVYEKSRFAGRSEIVPLIRVRINGASDFLELGTTLGQVLEELQVVDWSDPKAVSNIASRFQLSRSFQGVKRPVKFVAPVRESFDIPLLLGDEIKWN